MAGRVPKVPQVMQMEALECGAACLTMILAFFGKWVPLEQVRVDCGVSRDGSKASNILKAARAHGLVAKGMTFSSQALRDKGIFPCIIFWNFNHFVVLRGFKGRHALINDPARGQVKVPLDEFDQCFTGVALMFAKTDDFEEGGAKPDTLKFARARLEGLGSAIAFVMLTAALTSVIAILNTSLGQVFMDRILAGEDPEWLLPLTAIMLALAIVTAVVSVLRALYLTRIQGKIAVVSSSRFMRHLLHLPVGFYAQRMVGDLQQRQEVNETVAATLVEQLAPAVFNVVLVVLYLVIMLGYSWKLTLVGLVTVAVNVIVANWASHARVNVTRQQMRDRGLLYSSTMAGIESIETIKASGAEEGCFERWSGYQALVNDATVRFNKLDLYFAADPSVLVLDEATSALDNVTQRHVSDALAGLNYTRIVIAHRLSTIREADRIVMLEGGRIVEDGSSSPRSRRASTFLHMIRARRAVSVPRGETGGRMRAYNA